MLSSGRLSSSAKPASCKAIATPSPQLRRRHVLSRATTSAASNVEEQKSDVRCQIMSGEVTPPPVVLACVSTRASLLAEAAKAISTPRLVVKKGPHCPGVPLDDQAGDSLSLLGPDAGRRAGVARQFPMPDGGSITMRASMKGPLPRNMLLTLRHQMLKGKRVVLSSMAAGGL